MAACASPGGPTPTADPGTRGPGEPPRPTPTEDPTADALRRAREVLISAVDAHEQGQAELALTLLQTAVEVAPRGTATAQAASFLLGRRLLDRGDAPAALVALEAARASEGPLGPYVALALADAREATGADEVAGALRTALLDDPATPPDVRDAIIRAGDAGPAADLPALAAAAASATALAALLGPAAAAGATPVLETVVARLLEEYPAARQSLAAIEVAAAMGITLDPGLVGRALYRNRELERAIATLEPSLDEPGVSAADLALRTYYLAAAIDDGGDPAASVAYYDRVRVLVPGDQFAYRASYWAARALEATGETEAAVARYVALVRENPAGSFAAEGAFRAGFAWFEAGEPDRALAAWELTAAASDARALYWQGRALLDAGDETGARDRFAAAAADGVSFYAAEAQRRLDGAIVPFPVYRPSGRRADPDWDAVTAWYTSHTGLAAPEWQTATAAAALAELGLVAEARAALEAAASRAPGPQQRLALVREADEAGLASVAISLLQGVLAVFPARYEALPPTLQGVLYPLPLPEAVDEQARRHDIDPLLLAALVRQESLWDPVARSFAGALGLTQVLPATGEGIADALGITPFSPDMLLRPLVNLQFGAYYLGQQLRRFESASAALAAYNGGPSAAAAWAADVDPRDDPARFLESIPFQETHGYVEFVLTGFARYEALAAR